MSYVDRKQAAQLVEILRAIAELNARLATLEQKLA